MAGRSWRVKPGKEYRKIEEVDLMPFLLFKPPRSYARSARRKTLSSYLIKTSEASIHVLSLALLPEGNPHSTHSL